MTQIGLGCAQIGSSAAGASPRESIRLVHAAMDHGVLYFDTADAYGAGSSEDTLGRGLRGRRAAVEIATKGGYLFTERGPAQRRIRTAGARLARYLRAAVPAATRMSAGGTGYADQDFSTTYLTSAVEGSLRRLATDHIDVYQLHGPRHADPDEIAEWGSRMVASGKIGRLGIGAEHVDQAREWLSCPAVSSVQVPFGLLDVDAGVDVIPDAHASGRSVVARGVLAAGLLADPDSARGGNDHKLPLIEALRLVAADAGMSVTALAVDFVRARSDIDTILVGTRSPDHLGEVAAMIDTPLPDPGLLSTVEATLAANRWEHNER